MLQRSAGRLCGLGKGGNGMEPYEQGTESGIREEAASWLIEMEDEPERFDHPRFAAWLKASPRHGEEFLLTTAAWKAFDGVDVNRTIDVEKLLEESKANVVQWREKTQSTQGARDSRVLKRVAWVAGMAALTIAFMSAAWLERFRGSDFPTTFVTGIGEQRVVKLPDRSVLTLNADSRVKIRFTDSVREVRLAQGEALFSVEHDPRRPFRVMAGAVLVEAIGTQFNVYRRATDDTVVSVIEGRVRVVAHAVSMESEAPNLPDSITETPPEILPETPSAHPGSVALLTAGHQARITADGAIEPLTLESLADVAAWRERRLVFRDETLKEIAAEFNRYNVEPQIQIEGEALGGRRITAIFAADDPESLVQFLARDDDLSIIRSAAVIVIKAKSI